MRLGRIICDGFDSVIYIRKYRNVIWSVLFSLSNSSKHIIYRKAYLYTINVANLLHDPDTVMRAIREMRS